jgi:hypothetical protein
MKMKNLKFMLAVPVLAVVSLAGCSAQQFAQRAQNAITAALNIAVAEEAAVPAADQAPYKRFVDLGQQLNAQLNVCIGGVSGPMGTSIGTKAKFLQCFDAFAAGLLSPTELADLRVMTPKSQSKVELIATAVVTGVNIALSQFGGAVVTPPTIAPAPSAQELAPILGAMRTAAGI